MTMSTGKSTFQRILDWHEQRLPIGDFLDHSVGSKYPAPKNLNYFWNFGSLAGFMLVTMISTGIFLAMNYADHVSMAFDSVERIMRDVNFGWLIRYMHMNGASFFFIVVYIHIFRGLYYGSYKSPREVLWFLGIIILLLMMATAFMGYVLPWGQMSFWGATVITNLFSAIPLVGDKIVTTGGIHGRVTRLGGESVQIEIAEKVRIEVSKNAIGGLQGQAQVQDPEASQKD